MTTTTRPALRAVAKTLGLFAHAPRRPAPAPTRCPVARDAAREVLG